MQNEDICHVNIDQAAVRVDEGAAGAPAPSSIHNALEAQQPVPASSSVVDSQGTLEPPRQPHLAGIHALPPGVVPPRPPVIHGPLGALPPPQRGNTSQILQSAAEMIAIARKIQQQRMLQQQQQQSAAGGTAAGAEDAPGMPLPPPAKQLKRTADDAGLGHPTKERETTVVGMPMSGHPSSPAICHGTVTGQAVVLGEGIATSHDQLHDTHPHQAMYLMNHSGVFGSEYPLEDEVEEEEEEEGSGGSDTKKIRLVWTQELHNRFINALSQLGLKQAVPKNILAIMNVEGMTRENVASHLQKYRLYLKKIGGYHEKDKIEAEVLQSIHEHNVQQMAAQQAMQHSLAAMSGGYVGGAEPYAAFGGYQHHMQNQPAAIYAYDYAEAGGNTSQAYFPGTTVEGIPVSDVAPGIVVTTTTTAGQDLIAPLVPAGQPVSPTVTAAVAAGGHFNPQGWQYPPLPLQENPETTMAPPSYVIDTAGVSEIAGRNHNHGSSPPPPSTTAAGIIDLGGTHTIHPGSSGLAPLRFPSTVDDIAAVHHHHRHLLGDDEHIPSGGALDDRASSPWRLYVSDDDEDEGNRRGLIGDTADHQRNDSGDDEPPQMLSTAPGAVDLMAEQEPHSRVIGYHGAGAGGSEPTAPLDPPLFGIM